MERTKHHLYKRGYLTFVQNSPTVDYLNLAYLQCLSLKATQEINKYAILVDEPTADKITVDQLRTFDYVDLIEHDDAADDDWKLMNEPKADVLTPFIETVKLDCDILFTRNIDHWWPLMQKHDVLCTSKIRDYEGNIADDSVFRQLHKKNNMPSLYSGFTYFKYSKLSYQFFKAVKQVMENWEVYRDHILIDCKHNKPNTDEAYAIAAMLVGEEKCYNPAMDIPTFTHMKGPIQGWGHIDWTKYLYAQVDDAANLTVGFNRQMYPFHYVNKDFATEDLIERYKRILESS